MDPLPENPTFIKIDDDKFYLAKTTNEQFEVSAIQDELAILQFRIDALVATLQGAAAQGVANAQPLLDTISAKSLPSTL